METAGLEPRTRTFTELSFSIAETILQTELVFCYAMLPLHHVSNFNETHSRRQESFHRAG